jgi:nucleoside-diphosphate-sugar epimerase
MKETDKLPKPTDNYCRYKLKMENYIKNKLKSNPNFKVIIFRPATICGPSIRMRLDLLPNHFSYCAVSSGVIRISQPKGYRAFMDINDLIEAYFKVLKRGSWKRLIYNIGHYNLTKIDCARVIQKIVSCQIVLDPHVGDKRNLKIDCSAFEKEFNFKPKIKFEDTIKNVINWLKKNKKIIEKNNFAGVLNTTPAEWQKII